MVHYIYSMYVTEKWPQSMTLATLPLVWPIRCTTQAYIQYRSHASSNRPATAIGAKICMPDFDYTGYRNGKWITTAA